ncbi:YggT family protein [Natranaerobius thermophilus]|uniref:YggT family protein n=1 Tax=Natranaerobius thermophilus (strain ATCC BAA-1301 / DSM 18059 / JW/NM-WN-LF) TaxID=457570 RepID=B2A2I5_NATTJ|nr:YggT family protein [Natranaerobius thermophilus]ACB84900.1 protein of unknown function YGGT [Natranaerobius thermophilus JW/NM-WN-LF]
MPVVSLFNWIFQIVYIMLIIRVIFSFLRPSPYQNKRLYDLNKIIWKITEPVLAPIRNLISPLMVGGGHYIDLSPLIALLLLNLLQRLTFSLLWML